MENYSELGEMRQQISLLKGKLNDQEIVNDSIIRKVVQEKMDTINKAGWGIVVFGIFLLAILYHHRFVCAGNADFPDQHECVVAASDSS